MSSIAYRIAVLLLLITGVGLWARQQTPNRHDAGSVPSNGWTELTASTERMHAGMGSVKPSGNGDVDFARLMLVHHRAAIEMAKTQLMYGKDLEMRRLAQEIVTDQQSEIQLMELWLKRRETHKR